MNSLVFQLSWFTEMLRTHPTSPLTLSHLLSLIFLIYRNSNHHKAWSSSSIPHTFNRISSSMKRNSKMMINGRIHKILKAVRTMNRIWMAALIKATLLISDLDLELQTSVWISLKIKSSVMVWKSTLLSSLKSIETKRISTSRSQLKFKIMIKSRQPLRIWINYNRLSTSKKQRKKPLKENKKKKVPMYLVHLQTMKCVT